MEIDEPYPRFTPAPVTISSMTQEDRDRLDKLPQQKDKRYSHKTFKVANKEAKK